MENFISKSPKAIDYLYKSCGAVSKSENRLKFTFPKEQTIKNK